MGKPITFNFGGSIGELYDFTDKQKNISNYIAYMLDRVQSMFHYTNLPETIPERDFKLLIQTKGFACIPDPNLTGGNMYALWGGLGGEPNAYYMPTKCVVANPALSEYTTALAKLEIDKDCVIVPHDPMYMGLLPLFSRYATQLAENDVSIRIAQINTRLMNILTALDDNTAESAKQYLKDIEAGKLGVIGDNAFLNGLDLKGMQSQNGAAITELIELQQYLKAGWFNDIGLNANYNMKRESINSNEAQLNDDALLPLVDTFYQTQKTALDKVNAKFGSNIGIEYGSAWEDTQKESKTDSEVTWTDEN